MNPKQKQRAEILIELCAKDYTTFCYAGTKFHHDVLKRYWDYSNQFLKAISDAITQYGLEYYKECMKDHKNYGNTFLAFENQYNQATRKYVEQYSHYYTQQNYMDSQSGYYPQQSSYPQSHQNKGYPQNQYQGNYQQSQGNYQQQNYQNRQWGQQQYQNGQQGQGHQGHYQRQQFQHHQQDQPYNQQEIQYNQQGNQYQQGGHYNPRYKNYQQKGTYSQNQQGQNYPQGQYQGHQGQGHHYQQGGHYGQDRRHYKQNYSHGQHGYQHKQQQEKKIQPAEPVAPVEPPKPQPKPMKFSLKEIREFVNSFPGDEKDNISQHIIDKVNQVNGWTKREATFEQMPDKSQAPRFDKKASTRDRQQERSNTATFSKGVNYKPSEPPIQMGQTKKAPSLNIMVGKNESLESRKIKESIKGKAGQDFATVMEKQSASLDDVEKAKKEIIYNLNLLAPENIKAIREDLVKFLYQDERICNVLIQQIIEKAWGQPKYASTYAKLCSDFSKAKNQDFKFGDINKKDNPFKLELISNVQHSFDKKVEEVPEFQDEEEKETFLKNTKKKILGNVKFIAELIRSRVIRKRIMKICMAQLIHSFLAKYYNYRKKASLVDSYFDYYFEALIEFVENVGDFYEKMDIPKNQKYAFAPIKQIIIDLIEMNKVPPAEEIEELNDLKPDQYFEIFNIIDERVLKKKFSRLSALLLNLVQRRENNWQKHHAEAQGPKKLKDIKEDIAKQEQEMNRIKSEKKANLQHLNDLVKASFKNWEEEPNADQTKGQIKKILKEYSETEFFSSYLGQVADEKKENVKKRVDMFDVILENFYNERKFREAWLDTIRKFGFASSDYPFSGAAFALILEKIKEQKELNLEKFYLETTEEEEDQRWFMEEVYDKLYFYSKWEDIKKYVENPKTKHSNML